MSKQLALMFYHTPTHNNMEGELTGMKHTQAYVIWRSHSQQMLDFAVLVTTAAPQLDQAFQANTSSPPGVGIVANPIFRPSNVPYSTEKRALPVHQKVLGATLVLSIFSYFETYFFSVIDEIIDFHGGTEAMVPLIRKQFDLEDAKPRPSSLKFLQRLFKANRADRFRKYTTQVAQHGIMWPSQRFMLFGFTQAVVQRRRWRSVDIPDVMLNLLGLEIPQVDRDRFHEIRSHRNKVAHGKSLSYDLKKAIGVSNFFLQLSRRVEDHVLERFMILERYAH